MHQKKIFFLFFFSIFSLFSIEVEEKQLAVKEKDLPWFTGPLLAPSATVVPLGSVNFEPSIYLTGYSGVYDSDWKVQEIPFLWTTAFQFPLEFGIAPRIDFQVIPTTRVSQTEGQSAWTFGDLQLCLNCQIWEEGTYIPSIKLGIREFFPTGKYKNLNPHKLNTDVGGTGSYISTVGLVFAKLIQIRDIHYLSTRFTVAYDIPSAVYITGFNTYGGDAGTRGTYYPPQVLTTDLAFEYSFSKRWAFALDVVYAMAKRTRFKGIEGTGLTEGSPDISGSPTISSGKGKSKSLVSGASAQLSFAPAIEYSWSQNWGVIAGCWFPVFGKNAPFFQSGIIEINYYK